MEGTENSGANPPPCLFFRNSRILVLFNSGRPFVKLKETMADKTKIRKKSQPQSGNPSADLMYRLMSGNTVQLSQMADNKAHIMITICAGITGLSISHLFDPRLVYAASVVITSSLISLAFAVFTTMPRLVSPAEPDTKDPNFNILFFGDFVQLGYDRFVQELNIIAREPQMVYHTLARDAYILGKMLAEKKYRYLNYSYRTFLAGLCVGGAVLALSLVVGPRP